MAKKGQRRRARGEVIVAVGAAELLKMECLFPEVDDDEEVCHRIDIFATTKQFFLQPLIQQQAC